MIPHSKVFVGGLPSGSKPQELRRLFEKYGVVTECDIMNRCGFVHMETPQMADTAIRALHNTTFKGAVISVEPGRLKNRNAGDCGGMSRNGPGGVGDGSGSSMAGGPPRISYRSSRGGPGSSSGMESRGRPDGGVGPMRRDRGPGPRRAGGIEPYTRNVRSGGGGNYQDSFQGGNRNRNFDTNSATGNYNYGPPNTYSVGSGGASASIGGYSSVGSVTSYGMGSQDKRGFALPEHSHQSNRGSFLGSSSSIGMNQSGRTNSRSVTLPNPFSRAINTDASIGSSYGPNPFNRRGNMNSIHSERSYSGYSSDASRYGCSEQRSPLSNHGNGLGYPLSQNYNEAFPPLGANLGHRGPPRGRGGGIRGFGRGGGTSIRGGPPRPGMMSSFHQ